MEYRFNIDILRQIKELYVHTRKGTLIRYSFTNTTNNTWIGNELWKLHDLGAIKIDPEKWEIGKDGEDNICNFLITDECREIDNLISYYGKASDTITQAVYNKYVGFVKHKPTIVIDYPDKAIAYLVSPEHSTLYPVETLKHEWIGLLKRFVDETPGDVTFLPSKIGREIEKIKTTHYPNVLNPTKRFHNMKDRIDGNLKPSPDYPIFVKDPESGKWKCNAQVFSIN